MEKIFFLGNVPANNSSKSGLIAALDLGTNKVACLIAKLEGSKDTDGNLIPKIVGFGHQMSQGLQSGSITDLDEAEMTIRSTVEAAEREAGENIDNVIVNLGAPVLQSRLISFDVSVAGHKVSELDLQRIFDPSTFDHGVSVNSELIHTIPVGYSIDGTRGIRDPRGMYGDRLGVNLHIMSAKKGPIKNLETVISNCHLGIEKIVSSPFASALACLVEDEKQVGVTCIDIGAGTSGVSIFFDGELVFADIIPIGGRNITRDIAKGIATSMAHAERLKVFFGNAIPSTNDDHEVIKVPLIGESNDAEDIQISRSMLIGIIRPRLEEIFEILRERIKFAGFDKVAGRRAVLCGGGSQLPGLPELMGKILDKQVRLGKPMYMDGLPEFARGPEFSTCIGLLRYFNENKSELFEEGYQSSSRSDGKFSRLGQWLKESF